MIEDVHERLVAAPVERVWELLERLGGPDDRIWPSPQWTPMVFARPIGPGVAGGHGGIRYRVSAFEPGRRIELIFEPGQGLDGTHEFAVEPRLARTDAGTRAHELGDSRAGGESATLVRCVTRVRLSGLMALIGPPGVLPAHRVVIEQLLDRIESVLGVGPRVPARVSPWVRLLQRVEAERARPVPVPGTDLIAGALPRVDFVDAHAVPCRPGMPTDPQVWADAVFRSPPPWVLAALVLREALVGLVGIDRAGPAAFDTVARADDEVLLGTDDRHLDFRASVLREPDRVVLTTVTRIHNARGRAYFALVEPVHPVIVRAMLNRAARRLSRNSNADSPRPARIPS